MSEKNRNSHGIYTDIIRIRVIEMKAKIRAEKRKVRQELRKGKVLKDEINKLLFELKQAGIVENIENILAFMDGIDARYGLEDSCETELSRLYVEITEGFALHEDFEKNEFDEVEGEDSSAYTELIKFYDEAERKYLLCKSLFNRAELSNFEHIILRDRLESLKRKNMELSQLDIDKNKMNKDSR